MGAPSFGLSVRLVAWAVIGCGLVGAGAACGAKNTGIRVLYVSPRGSDSRPCTRSEPCRTIGHAVARARVGAVIEVARGTYREQVFLTKRLTIQGEDSPVIDASSYGRGILISGPRAAGSSVRGVDVENATYEGILALRTSNITIADDDVNHNDRGYFDKHFTGECSKNGGPPEDQVDLREGEPEAHPVYLRGRPPAAQPVELREELPGTYVDLRAGGCGEAIHLASTSDSSVTGNLVTDNTGGIYLTDESGPAAHNMIAHNEVIWNIYDCGITLASHSRRAVSVSGRVQPNAGGVYDNTITQNVAESNGMWMPGAGILVAAAFSGSAAYSNRIIDNVVSGNGLPGVALHSHTTRQDLNSNVILDNVVGQNAIGGVTGGPGDGDGGVHHTVGILVWSAVTKITHVQISGNLISDDYFGIWTENTPHLRSSANSYQRVLVPLMQRKGRAQASAAAASST